ncbi:MAG: tetratricopeptide repeat protein, partial [Calditrichaeota bacterium]|nr:tetratricopeptide repeat protein [Calditrichota bacterium]
ALAKKFELFYEKNQKIVLGAAAAVFLVVMAIFLIRTSQQRAYDDASLELTIAKIMFDMGRLDEAEPQLQAIKSKYGGRIAGEAQYYLARSAFMRGGIEEAEAAFREYLRSYHVDKYMDAGAAAGLAACVESRERYEEAAEIYLSIPRKYPKHFFSPQAMYQAARCYLLANQRDKAIEICQLLQRQYPTSAVRSRAAKLITQLP